MKKGKYRFIVQRSQEILMTITDEAQFQKDFQHWAGLLGPDRDGEVTELDYLRSRAHKLNSPFCAQGIEKKIENEHIYIEDVRTCRQCGCTEDAACITEEGPCRWVSEGCCSNPDCIAQAEKEVQHG